MAAPTNAGERKMAATIQAHQDELDAEPPVSPEEQAHIQERNLREIRITYRRYKNEPKLREQLEKEFNEGKGVDFPSGATLEDKPAPATPPVTPITGGNSQAAVRRSDNAIAAGTNTGTAPGSEDRLRAPNIQLTSRSADTSLQQGADAMKGYVEQSRAVIDDLIKQTTDSTEAAAAAHARAAASITAAGASKALEALSTGEIEAAGAQARERVLSIANLDSRRADNAFSTMLAERLKLRGRRETLGKEIDTRNSVGLFDNPIEWLVNQTILPGQINSYNNMAREENDMTHNMASLQNEVAAQERLDMGATSDMFAKRATQVANAEVATATAKAEEIRAGSAALVAQRVMTIAGLRERELSHMETMSRWSVAFADRREASQKKQEELETDRDLDRRVKVIGTVIGNNMASMRWLKGQGKDVQEAWAKRAGTLSLGDSLYESNEFVRRFGDLNNMRLGGAGELADMFRAFDNEITKRSQNIQATWTQLHPNEPKLPKNAEAREMAANQMQVEWEVQRDQNMFRADQLNPYKINHRKEALAFKGDPKNPVFQMSKDAYSNSMLIDDKVLLSAVTDLVTSGQMKPREAASAISEYYIGAVRRNNTERNIKDMGMDKQENYKVKFDGAKAPIDLMNPVSVENYFTRESTVAKARASGFVVPSGMDVGQTPGIGGKPGDYFLKYPETKEPNKDVLVKKAKERAAADSGAK